jgi:UDP-2,3-diacylglucosamine pyrophosphatase LpxH
MRTLILSDLHLGSRHANVELINELLDQERYDRLILNGDTINNVNFRKLNHHHWKLLDRFKKIGRERDLVLVRGNHDHDWDFQPGLNGDSQAQTPGVHGLRESSGLRESPLGTAHVLPAILEVPMREDYPLDVGDRRYLVLHGDRFDPTLNYPLLTDAAVLCYQLTTKINKKLAKWLKKKSKRFGGLLEFIRAQSVSFARKAELTGVITGHTHFAEDLRVGDVHYVNSGSWTESPCGFIIIEKGEIKLHHMSD